MATVYGSKVNKVWRAYMTYSVTTTPTQVKVSITSGLNIPNDGYNSHRSFTCSISGTGQTTVSGSISNKKYVGVLTKAIKSVTYTWNRASTAQTKTIKTVLKGYGESTTSSCRASISVPALAPATITFDANGGSGTVPTAISTYVGVANTIPSNSLTRAGYTFDGWNTASDGSGTAYATGSTITPSSNVTLYAQWETTYVKPEIQNLLAFRTANDSGGASPTVTSTGTTGFCKFELVGGSNYTFTSASVQFGTAAAKSMTRSGTTVYGYSASGSIAQASAYTVTVTVVVKGADGVSRTYTDSTYISKSVPVFDATPNSFALGGFARDVTGDEKPFDCYMDATFHENVDVTGNMNVLGRVTTGKAISNPYAHYSGTAGSTTINTASKFYKLSSFSGFSNSHMISDGSYFEADTNGFKVLKSGTYLLILNAHYNTSAASTQMATRFLDYTGNVQVGYIMYNCNPTGWGMLSNHVIAHIDANHIVVPEFQKYSTATSNWKPSQIKYSMILLTED